MLDRAWRAWPAQPAYSTALASIAARNGDSRTVVAALSHLASLEAGIETTRDSGIIALGGRDATVAAAQARLARALAVRAHSTLHYQLRDSTLFPEGVAVNRRTGALYVTSIRHRTIIEISAEGVEREIIPRDQQSPGAMLAVRVDGDGEHLWATMAGLPLMHGYAAADSSMAALLRVRITDGAIVGKWTLPATQRHVPGDVAVAPNGDVFISDSQNATLYRLRKGGTELEPITHRYFRSLQGMAITGDNKFLYMADYSHGLLRVSLQTGDVQPVVHADSISTLGLDGVVLHGSSLIAVQNGAYPARIVRYELSGTGMRILSARTIDRQSDIADEPTNGVMLGDDFVYIANSQWEKYDGDGQRLAAHALTAPRLLRLPVGPPLPPR